MSRKRRRRGAGGRRPGSARASGAARTPGPEDPLVAAHRRLQAGDLKRATALYQSVLTVSPSNVEALLGLGRVGLLVEDFDTAAGILGRAVAAEPDHAVARYLLARALDGRVEWPRARDEYAAAVELDPAMAPAWNGLGGVLVGLGRRREGIECFRRAIDLDPEDATARWNLGRYCFDGSNFAESAAALGRALERRPDAGALQCDYALILMLEGRAEEARRRHARAVALEESLRHTADSHAYIRDHGRGARYFASAAEVLTDAVAGADGAGLFLEFGVYRGNTINLIAEAIPHPVYGFDSFEGLPADWAPGHPQGMYSTGGLLPEVRENVTLVPGWFEETLPRFLTDHPGRVSFVNVDCDLYASTDTVLRLLEPRIGTGTVLLFDEYLGYPGWRDHEFKAFQEFIARGERRYDYIGINVFGKQVAIRIT